MTRPHQIIREHWRNTARYWHRQRLPGKDPSGAGSESQNEQLGLHQIEKFLYFKRNSQESEEATDRMGKIFANYAIDEGK